MMAWIVSGQLLAQSDSLKNDLLQKRLPAWVKPVLEKSELAKNYTIIDTINPFYFEDDFTGDKKTDIALLVRSNENQKTGILFINGGKNTVFVMGAGKEIGMGDHMNWCNRWYVYRSKGLYDGHNRKKVTLKGNAIEIFRSEKLTLYIYWAGKKYKSFVRVND